MSSLKFRCFSNKVNNKGRQTESFSIKIFQKLLIHYDLSFFLLFSVSSLIIAIEIIFRGVIARTFF